MTTPTREAAFGPYEPLSEEDRAILNSWLYKPDDPKAEATVRVHRLQRWLNSLLIFPFMKLHTDGKVGPNTASAVETMMWSEEEASVLRSLGFHDPFVMPGAPAQKTQEPAAPRPVPRGVIIESTPRRYATRDRYFDNFPESDPREPFEELDDL